MKSYLAAAIAVPLLLGGCSQFTQAVSTACSDIARMPPVAVAVMDAQDPHSTVGVIWANMKSGCANGLPVVGVDQSWSGMLWGELKVLIPQLLPQLIPVLFGLL